MNKPWYENPWPKLQKQVQEKLKKFKEIVDNPKDCGLTKNEEMHKFANAELDELVGLIKSFLYQIHKEL